MAAEIGNQGGHKAREVAIARQTGIAQEDGGTIEKRVQIGEYSWGAINPINGALAQADVPGIFGGEALNLPTRW